MKSLLLIFLFIFSTLNLSAIVLDTDTFDGTSADGWSRDDDDSDSYDGYLQINKDQSSYKTFSFGNSYANAEVTVSFYTWLYYFSSSGDKFKVTFNDSTTQTYYGGGDGWSTLDKTLTTNLDSDGNLKIEFSTDPNKFWEKSYTDYVVIEYTSTVPTITPATYTLYNKEPTGTIVGTIVSTNSPDTFTILSGDINNTFSVTNSGEITVQSGAALENNTTSTFTLEINASNASGYDVEDFIINLTDDINLSTDDINTREFTNVSLLGQDSLTINGSILQIGNQLLCKNSSNGGTCVDPTSTGNTQNNYHTQYYAKIDTSGAAPSNNSMAKLVLEDGDEVVFARLYWSARIESITSAEKTNAKSIQIKGPNTSSYTSYTSPNAKFNWHDSGGFFDYAASQDVTDYVATQGEGEYYVGGITAETGETGTYASWQLIVVVENSSRSLKNLSIYDGFYSVYSGDSDYPTSVEVNASGFITPDGTSTFDANLFIYMGESDNGYDDSIEILTKDGDPDVAGDWTSLSDGSGQADDVVNASVYSPDYTGGYRSNDSGMANPNFKNVLGVDIDKLQINIEEDASQQVLSNSQTSTSIKITSTGDRFSLNMFAFETEVFIPEFCYDYAYEQNDQYFTEDNNGSKDPEIVGNVVSNTEFEVSIFIKSLVDSSLSISNLTIDISDINTTQATYINDSTRIALTGQLNAADATVTSGTSGTSGYINNIFIGDLISNDYFYIFYKLNPSGTSVDMPLSVQASYDLDLNPADDTDELVPYTLKLSEDIPMCSYNNFNYLPAAGIFNVVHEDYSNASLSSGYYYNLPTQVTRREGNFKVLSMDEDDYDVLKGRDTVAVAVELIDVGSFHYTDASCKKLESSISPRVWVVFENNETVIDFDNVTLQNAISTGMTELTSSDAFYANARQNTAFRVTYNSLDDNGSLIKLDPIVVGGETKYNVLNFPSLSGNCSQDMDNNPNSTDKIPQYCNNAGGSGASAMSSAELKTCMECIYGYDTRFLCSRDNFSLRPEAFSLKINDQTLRLADDASGVASPVATVTNLAAGYDYNLEVNATNFLNSNASPGYTKSFPTGSSDIIGYEWSPTGTVSGCNDLSDYNVSADISDGQANVGTSLEQVGEYILHMEDTTWTVVDNDSDYMVHHDAPYFVVPTTQVDCTPNVSTTQPVNSSTLNGCNISSNHTGVASGLSYRDYSLVFNPYKFKVSTAVTIGINNITPPTLTEPFIYMADISDDVNMSVQLNTVITAQGENNASLSNFVKSCFAKPTNIDIKKSIMTNTALEYKYSFQDKNSTGDIIIPNHDINVTLADGLDTNTISLTTTNNFFQKDMLGSIDTVTSLNFNREVNEVANPEKITFITYEVSDPNNTFNADLVSNKTAEGYADINKSTTERLDITHFYGKAHAGRQRYEVANDGDIQNANIYYEIFCYGDINGNTCNPALLPSTNRTNDIRWYINSAHNTANDGNVNTVVQQGGSMLTDDTVDTTNPVNANPTTTTLSYDGLKGYPYKTTMEINASNWLIYNKYDSAALVNEFPVEFEKAGTGWSGEHETNTTTVDTATVKTNRRSMW
ncbi:hypothetical protein N9X61_00495 [Sulfurimonas sp.]|nr:hypothetical protein [Sulfurimonas sp.]